MLESIGTYNEIVDSRVLAIVCYTYPSPSVTREYNCSGYIRVRSVSSCTLNNSQVDAAIPVILMRLRGQILAAQLQCEIDAANAENPQSGQVFKSKRSFVFPGEV